MLDWFNTVENIRLETIYPTKSIQYEIDSNAKSEATFNNVLYELSS